MDPVQKILHLQLKKADIQDWTPDQKYDIIKKVSTRYELPDGAKLYGKQIAADPEKYFTEDIMEKLEAAANKEFLYGKGSDAELSTGESTEE